MISAQHGALREEVREAILDSVGRLLVKYGYKKMTVEDIAREAGIGKGTVYLYFPSKEEVALGSFDRAHDRMAEELHAIADSDLEPDKSILGPQMLHKLRLQVQMLHADCQLAVPIHMMGCSPERSTIDHSTIRRITPPKPLASPKEKFVSLTNPPANVYIVTGKQIGRAHV